MMIAKEKAQQTQEGGGAALQKHAQAGWLSATHPLSTCIRKCLSRHREPDRMIHLTQGLYQI